MVIWGFDWLATIRLDLELLLRRTPGHHAEGEGTSQKALKKKRAREAREALEQTASTPMSISASVSVSGHSDASPSIPSMNGLISHLVGNPGDSPKYKRSSDDPEFVKIHGAETFSSISGVGWFGQGEMGVVERPWGDFVGELPGQFRTAGFGRG